MRLDAQVEREAFHAAEHLRIGVPNELEVARVAQPPGDARLRAEFDLAGDRLDVAADWPIDVEMTGRGLNVAVDRAEQIDRAAGDARSAADAGARPDEHVAAGDACVVCHRRVDRDAPACGI
ncbi:MAG: hypothetical protein P8Y76_12110 [bacterium]